MVFIIYSNDEVNIHWTSSLGLRRFEGFLNEGPRKELRVGSLSSKDFNDIFIYHIQRFGCIVIVDSSSFKKESETCQRNTLLMEEKRKLAIILPTLLQ
jgi:hypothetical protein